jgi:hypothetical protein
MRPAYTALSPFLLFLRILNAIVRASEPLFVCLAV